MRIKVRFRHIEKKSFFFFEKWVIFNALLHRRYYNGVKMQGGGGFTYDW